MAGQSSSSDIRRIIHVDMDCFYAAIEIRDNPSLANKPVAVGGRSDRRGVISTCNYIAREFGVHSAMATKTALKLCPTLIVVNGHMDKYVAVSKKLREIFQRYTPLIEPLSLDEAYLDVTHVHEQFGSATEVARQIMDDIWQDQQLRASAGVAPNKFLAKIASDWKKPNGLFVIKPHHINRFVKSLAVKKLPGVGPVTAQKCHDLGLFTCEDIQAKDERFMLDHFGKYGVRLKEFSRGVDQRAVSTSRRRKSLSVEKTFAQNIMSEDDISTELGVLYQQLQERLSALSAKQSSPISGLFVKIKFHDFVIKTSSLQTDDSHNLALFASALQRILDVHQAPIRLLGLGVRFTVANKASDSERQLSLY